MPYLFGGLVLLNALTLGYFLFVKQPTTTQSLQEAQAQITQPLAFTNSAKYIPPPIGSKE
ncbi:hypothetical protein [Psychrobacter sp. DM8]|uniref:hypothetical protein n=1 Tax=Psychrobacter sp. DM8 TaxID=3440636 RepID=UPI003F4FF6BA